MIDLGTVRPGSTIRIPFSSFDKDDGSSITMTNYAVGDILIYKDGSTTERASTSGFTATTDFDGKTGKHLAIIDLSDNTTSGFYNAGSEYLVAIDAVTVDTVTTGGWIGRFRIGYPGAVLDTTIATLSSQTSFTLTTGPAEDDALNGRTVIIHDIASAVQMGSAVVLDYTGSTKTVTLAAGTTFTAAAGDNISIMDPAPLQPATAGRTLVVDSAGLADANTVKLGPSGAGTAQTAKDVGGAVPAVAAGASGGLLISGSNSGTTTLGALTVSGATTLAALSMTTLTASGAVAFQSTFAVTTSTSLAALSCTTLTASGAVAFQSTFAVSGTVTYDAFTVTNATTLSGAVSLGSTLGVTGTATFAAVTTTGTVTLNALTVSNATTLSGAVSLGSTLSVTGATTLAALSMTTLTASGAVAFQSTFATTGTVTFNALTVTNATTLSGAVTATHASNDIRGVSVSSIGTDVITSTSLAASAVAEIQAGLSTLTAAQVDAIVDLSLSDVGLTTTVTGRIDAAISSRMATFTLPTNFSALAITAGGAITVGTNNDKTGYSLSATGVDLVLVAGKTLPNAIKYIGASCAGTVTGAGTGTEVFKDFAGTTAITVTVDVDGNRSSVVYA